MNNYLLNRKLIVLLLSMITHNLYSQTFVDQTAISLPASSIGSVAWGDYDNDGYLDILLTGSGYSKIYRNNGDNTFTEQTGISLAGVYGSSIGWSDYDNDGYLDVLLTGSSISKIYRNNGNNTFTEQTEIALPGVFLGSGVIGDLNNDGNQDILLAGLAGSYPNYYPVSRMYQNNGNNTFTDQSTISLIPVSESAIALGDYDNDGDQDILLTGSISSDRISKIYRNDGNNTFTEQTSISLTGVMDGSVAWGDYDNDSDLDILLTGFNNSGQSISKIYRNNGNNSFTDQTEIVLTGVSYGSVAWGDYDNDGNLDILLTGQDNQYNIISKIYHNNGNNTFTEQTGITLEGVMQSSVTWGDYDNDGDLDILLTGNDASGNRISKIYRNDIGNPNTKPFTPANLQTSINNEVVTFTWDKANDTQTSQTGLSYNLYVYESAQSTYKYTPHAFRQTNVKNGKRLITKIGNIQWNAGGYSLRNLPPEKTYYWSVQAIDAGLSGGNFAVEQSFIMPLYRPVTQSCCINITNVQDNQATLTWASGGNSKRAIFIKAGTSGVADPVDNTTYAINSLTPGGWKCVYNGTANTATITGLIPNNNYIVQVCEYNGASGNEKYLNTSAYHNPISFNTIFTEQTSISITGVQGGSVTWGDYDNDGDLDILLTGLSSYVPVSKIYRNNGNNTFTEQTSISLTGFQDGSAAWGDYDNDGDMDILLTGQSISGLISKIYRNNSNNTFTEQTGISLTGVQYGSVAWGDYDNDGYLDILMTGRGENYIFVSKIYRNNGNNTFSEQTQISLQALIYSSAIWADYNNDGNLDIVLTGTSNADIASKIYRNNGDNTFTDQTGIVLSGVFSGVVACGDYDNDSDLDILMNGRDNLGNMNSISKIYRNDGNNNFSDQTGISLTGIRGVGSWGDYDNDGNLDILLHGLSSSDPIFKIYRNNGDNSFSEQTSIPLTGFQDGSAAWGDYDNDGDLDILLTGKDASGNEISKIYRNNSSKINKNPDPPQNLTCEVQNNSALLKWKRVTTDETSSKSLTYNVKVGRKSGYSNFVTSQSGLNGFRKIVAMGNRQLDSSFILKNLRWDTLFYASVQAVDNSYKGGAFSNEIQFKSSPVQPSQLIGNHTNNVSLQLRWKRGNGDRCILFAKEGTSGTASPQNYTTYYANPIFGEGSPLGSTGWYCIYKGEADSILLYGLNPQKNYIIHAIEFQGANGSEIYAPTVTSDNIGVFSSALFSEQSGIAIIGVTRSSVAWGDYNNDGFSDILLTGSEISKIYRNNGDNTFTDQTGISLTGVASGSAAWGDYDNDGDLDIILTGEYIYNSYTSKIYRNNSNDTFTEQTDISLTGVYQSSVAWGDYDNDGYLDILLTGATGGPPLYKPVSKIYHNNGDNTFTEQQNISLTGVHSGSASWFDNDNDGDLDILLLGTNAVGESVSTLYRNNGDNTFTSQNNIFFGNGASALGDYDNDGDLDLLSSGYGSTLVSRNESNNTVTAQNSISLPGAQSSSVAWGDFDNDGNLDILLTGFTNPGIFSKIYHNNGNNSFSEQTSIFLIAVSQGSVALGDYDNDGDLDILLTGNSQTSGIISRIFRNNLIMKAGNFKPNVKPDAPAGLKSTFNPGSTFLSWSQVTTDETPSNSMSYNLRYKLKNAQQWNFAAHAADNGFRRVASLGNVQLKNSFSFKNLAANTYYWQVQAVDQAFEGGAWSEVDSFVVKNIQAFFKTDNVCLGLTTHFTDQSVATDGIASWHWDFSDGLTSSDQNPSHLYSSSGTFNVKLVITDINGVKDSLVQAVIVRPKPSVDFSAPAVCQGTATPITNSTDDNGLTISSWFWDFGDGQTSIAQQPAAHGYLGAAEYTVVLKALADNGCLDTIAKKVIVGAYPIAAVTANAPLTFCKGDSVTLTVPYNADYNYSWKPEGTTISVSDSSRFVADYTGNFVAKVINRNGNCETTSAPVSIVALPAPAAPSITYSGNITFCQGDSIVLSVANTSGYSYQWKLNGGAVGTNANQYTAKNSGKYSLVVSNSNGCSVSSPDTVVVTVNPLPIVSDITLVGVEKFCRGGKATLSVQANSTYAYSWKRGTSDLLLTTNSIDATESGEYYAEVSLAGCKLKTVPRKIEVVDKPSRPDINPGTYKKDECLGDVPPVLSVDNIVPGYTYQWYKNETPLSTAASIEVSESGNYYLEAVIDICPSERALAEIVFPATLPKPNVIAKGPTVWILSTNSKAEKYKWYYNGNYIPTADNKSAYLAGQNMGIYRVAISNDGKCFSFSDKITIPDIVGIENPDPFKDVRIYPNPTTGTFTIEMDNNVFGELMIDIFTQNGSKVLNIKFEKTTEHFLSQIDLSGQPKGMYIINFTIKEYKATRKLIVE